MHHDNTLEAILDPVKIKEVDFVHEFGVYRKVPRASEQLVFSS